VWGLKNVKARTFVVLILVIGSFAGIFVANMVSSRLAAARASTFETRRRVVQFNGTAVEGWPSRTADFSVPATARVEAALTWWNPAARLSESLRHDGLTVTPAQVVAGPLRQVRVYTRVASGVYRMYVRARHGRAYFKLVVTATWTVEVRLKATPTPTPTPTGATGSTPTPTPSESPSPAPSPAPTSKVNVFSVGTAPSKFGSALSNPYVAGVSQRFGWAAIEPASGDYRWTAIDNLIAQARSAGKLAMIRVTAGIYTPDWVNQQVGTLTFSNAYLYNPAAYPSQVTMPIPWDATYLSLWKRFITAFGQRYDGNPTIYSVQMTGGGFIGEMTLPTDVDKWKAAGYTDATYISTWEDIIGAYRTAFPNTHTNLDIVEPFGGVLATSVVQPVVSFATSAGASNAYIQNNALRATMLGTIGPYRQVIRSSASVTTVGYQMIGDAATSTSLTQAFTVALQDQASYVEVYASDVLDPANQDALGYLSSGGPA
jgi:hypothetical protein